MMHSKMHALTSRMGPRHNLCPHGAKLVVEQDAESCHWPSEMAAIHKLNMLPGSLRLRRPGGQTRCPQPQRMADRVVAPYRPTAPGSA
jgi:hypothetical protein